MILFVLLPIIMWTAFSVVVGRTYINMTWYNTLPCFPIGMFIAAKEEEITSLIKKIPIKIILIMTGILFLLSAVFLLIAKDMIYMFFAIYSVLCYVVFVHFGAVRSLVWAFIGKHSLSVYLIHLLLIDISQRSHLDITEGTIVLFLLIATLVFAVILDAVVGKIVNIITQNIEQISFKR